jgi:1-deoxy-D-xylulose-5-phosphate reductoisomerase
MRATPSSSLQKKRVVLLGATGSIGENTLRVIEANPDRLELVAVAAKSGWKKLAQIALKHAVRHVALFDESALGEARASGAFAAGTKFYGGPSGLKDIACLDGADAVLVAVVGTTGLEPTLAAIAAQKEIALASKEILVLGGKFVMAAAAQQGVPILPVDSEHSAVFQCLEGHRHTPLKRIILTASGGAFRDWPAERLAHATPADALKHPTWTMGAKVTLDSATLANKGLELIEAQWLFGLKPSQCTAVVHPQSIVHSLVEFIDGSMLAQISTPSMTFPIQYALLYPERVAGVDKHVDLTQALSLDFRPIDGTKFPMFALAQQAMEAGGVAPAVYNAANEVAVAAFLKGNIPFLAIPAVVGHSLADVPNVDPAELPEVLASDAHARRVAEAEISRLSRH